MYTIVNSLKKPALLAMRQVVGEGQEWGQGSISTLSYSTDFGTWGNLAEPGKMRHPQPPGPAWKLRYLSQPQGSRV